jgi:hypothetical protein
MPETLIATFTQFGAAGLIGALWLFERRHAAHRERQLDEAHRQLMASERQVDALLRVVQENTRAVNSLQHSQRRLIGLLGRMAPAKRPDTP